MSLENIFSLSQEIDPTASLNLLKMSPFRQASKMDKQGHLKDQNYYDCTIGSETGDDDNWVQEDGCKEPQHKKEMDSDEEEEAESAESEEDFPGDYKFSLPGAALPQSLITNRQRKRNKLKTGGKSLSHEARSGHQKYAEPNLDPFSMGAFSSTSSNLSEALPRSSPPGTSDSPSHVRGRNTLHELRADRTSSMSSSTPKSSKKLKTILRTKDRDEKKDFLLVNSNALSTTPILDVSRSLSEGNTALSFAMMERVCGTTADIALHTDNNNPFCAPFNGGQVAQSLNLYRRDTVGDNIGIFQNNHRGGRSCLRRTNSDAQFTLGLLQNKPNERRCPPDRKQFYRQFIKSIKDYGIKGVAASRLETPSPTPLSRFHSVDLAATNPFSPTMQNLWIELRAYLKDREPKAHEEWLFFNQHIVEKVLHKILHFHFSLEIDDIGAVSAHLLKVGYEPVQDKTSSQVLHCISKVQEHEREVGGEDDHFPFEGRKEREEASGRDVGVGVDGIDYATCSIPSRSGVLRKCVKQQDCLAIACSTDREEPSSSFSHNLEDFLEYCPDKLTYRYYLSFLQIKALSDVDKLMEELDKVESLYMNRKRMGDEYPTYRTLFFKRRVSALILWHKVTYGLAEDLCRLSDWLGTVIARPELCRDPSTPLHPPSSSSPSSSVTTTAISMSLNNSTSDAAQSPTSIPFSTSNTTHQMQACSYDRFSSSLYFTPPLSPNSTNTPYSPTHTSSPQQHDNNLADSVQGDSKPTSQVPVTFTVSSSANLSTDAAHQQPLTQQGTLHEPYRDFVSGSLKRKGLDTTTKRLKEFMGPVLRIAKFAMGSPAEPILEHVSNNEEHKPLLDHVKKFMHPSLLKRFDEETHELPTALLKSMDSVAPDNWMMEFESMGLPSFSGQYMQLVHVLLDVMHECLRLQGELGKELQEPSPLSVRQLADECREILEYAIDVRVFYRDNMEAVLRNHPGKSEEVEADVEAFEMDMKKVLKIYFHYLKTWVNLSSGHILEEEWRKVKTICTNIRGGEAEAGRKFCDMVTQLLDSMGDDLECKMDECCSTINLSHTETDLEPRDQLTHSCREFKELFVWVRERVNRVLGFAKILRKDLEIAADFEINTSIPDLFSILKSSDHVRVILPDQKLDKMIFVPECTSENPDEIQHLLNVSFAHGNISHDHNYMLKDSYILLFNIDVLGSLSSAWSGKIVKIHASTETTINLSELQVDSMKMVVENSAHLTECRSSFMRAVNRAVILTKERTSSHENVADRISDLKFAACELAKRLMTTASKVMEYLNIDDNTADEHINSYRSTMYSCFNLGFEYVRDVFRLLGDDKAYKELGEQALDYTLTWIDFVLEKCERGRGTPPRWASTGLEFMTVACAPTTLASIPQKEYEKVKILMKKCVMHVIGEAPATTAVTEVDSALTRLSKQQRTPWRKTRKLLYGSLGFSFSNMSSIADEVEVDPLFKLPAKECSKKGSQVQGLHQSSLILSSGQPPGNMKTMAPPELALHNSKSTDAAEIDGCEERRRGRGGGDQAAWICDTAGHSQVSFQQQSSIATPPTSSESLHEHAHTYSSSGVDSPSPSTSDIKHTPCFGGRQRPTTSTPTVHNAPLFTIGMDRMDSTASSTSSAGHYYTQYSSSGGAGTPLCRSDSGASINGEDRITRIQEKIRSIDKIRENQLRNKKQIGQVSVASGSALNHDIALRILKQTKFKWQRGRKLGNGSFGVVYECLNRSTGEINAVKQISIKDKDSGAIQAIVDEISNFQKLSSDYIVKFYGVEVYHNELYMFMEYCGEGTLWTIAQQGLTEEMMRHYTRDILKAVDTMHTHGMVHRDIKGANIFLSSNGSIKLGDFGLSVQLQNLNNTKAKEVQKQAGTIPYIAPEIVLSSNLGKPMDIWAVGCVVVEMATGKLPWAECNNPYTIMYKLGLGTSPSVPESALSKEGHRFLVRCFTFDAQERPSAIDLSNDPFVKVRDD